MPSPPLRRDFVDEREVGPNELSAEEYNLLAQRADEAFDNAEAALARNEFTDEDKTKLDGLDPSDFATAAQGTLADSAVQPADLGSAAAADTADFATAAQGALADSAVQPDDLGSAAMADTTDFAPVPSGTPNGTKFYADDNTWKVPPGGGSGATPIRVNVGTGSAGPYDFAHGAGTTEFLYRVFRNAGHIANNGDGSEIWIPVVPIDDDNARLDTTATYAANQLRVVLYPLSGSDITPPATPTLTEVDTTPTTITVSATAGAASYDWLLDGVFVEKTATNSKVYGGLLAGTEYDCRVIAYDLVGNPAMSTVVPITTDASADVTPPTAGAWSMASKTTTSITYQEDTSGSDNVGVVGVDAYDGDTNTLLQANVTEPWVRSGLTALTQYKTFFRYRDAAGLHADSATVTITTDAAPSGPTDVTTDATSAGGSSTSGSLSITITVGEDADYLTAGSVISVNTNAASWDQHDVLTAVSSIDGPLTRLGSANIGNQNLGSAHLWGLANPSPGIHTITFTTSDASTTFSSTKASARSYIGVGSVGTPVPETNFSAAYSQTVTSAVHDRVVVVAGFSTLSATGFAGATVFHNFTQSVNGVGDQIVMADAAGAASVNLTANSGPQSGGVAINLQLAA